MRLYLKLFVWSLLLSCVTGCIDTKQEFFINPDGSGKVIHESTLQSMNITIGKEQSAESKQKKIVKDEIEKSLGVETWKNVSYEPVGEDQVKFKGTAYFKDVNKLKIYNGGSSISVSGRMNYQLKGDKVILELKNTEETVNQEKNAYVDYSKDELAAKIEEHKNEYQKARVMLAGVLPSLRYEKVFHFSGKLETVHNFIKREDGALVNVVEGSKMLEAVDRLMEDDELIRSQLKQGRSVVQGHFKENHRLNELLFGEKGPVQAILRDVTTPLFDYATEVAAAKQDYAKVSALLNLPKKVTVSPSDIGQFKVAGIRLIAFTDQDNGIRPFNLDEGYTLSVVGTLPEKVLMATEGRVVSAVADNGTNLLPENEWERKINFITLGEDQQTVIFDVNFNLPSKEVQGLKEVSGEIVFVTANGFKEVDLHFIDFSEGAKGWEFDAEIVKVGDDQWSPGKQTMELKVALAKYKIKDVEIFDEKNQKIQIKSEGYNTWGENTTINYRLEGDGGFPKSGKIVIHVFQNLQNFEMPFILSDISLLGRKK